MSIDLTAIADHLERGSEGIWVSRSRAQISYPEEGNQNCLAIEANSFWFAHRNRCIQSVVQRFSPPGPLFDIGGGNGYVAAGLKQAGIPVVLVEPGWQGARNAHSRGVDTIVCSTLEDAGFHENTLPAAGLFDVLEHIAEESAFLSNLQRLLEPGGKVYLTVPAHPLLWSADDDYAGHYRRYTTSSLRRVLESAGFSVQFSTYIFWMLPLPILLFRALPTRLGWRKQESWERYLEEHRRRPGIPGWLMNALLAVEESWLRQGRSLWVGGSCLAVAEKQ